MRQQYYTSAGIDDLEFGGSYGKIYVAEVIILTELFSVQVLYLPTHPPYSTYTAFTEFTEQGGFSVQQIIVSNGFVKFT